MELVVAEVVAILGKYAISKGEALFEGAQQVAIDAARNLYETVIGGLRADPATAVLADGFENDPDGYAIPVKNAIKSKVDADPALAAQLAALMETIKGSTTSETWSNVVTGSGAIAVNHANAVGQGGNLATQGGIIVTGGTLSESVGTPEERTPP